MTGHDKAALKPDIAGEVANENVIAAKITSFAHAILVLHIRLAIVARYES
ncbi:MAG: hypothetical protein AAF526_10295 [Pseudomonadota bacterium]